MVLLLHAAVGGLEARIPFTSERRDAYNTDRPQPTKRQAQRSKTMYSSAYTAMADEVYASTEGVSPTVSAICLNPYTRREGGTCDVEGNVSTLWAFDGVRVHPAS